MSVEDIDSYIEKLQRLIVMVNKLHAALIAVQVAMERINP